MPASHREHPDGLGTDVRGCGVRREALGGGVEGAGGGGDIAPPRRKSRSSAARAGDAGGRAPAGRGIAARAETPGKALNQSVMSDEFGMGGVLDDELLPGMM